MHFRFASHLMFAAMFAVPIAHAAPIVPGLHQKHPLDETQRGHVLMSELRCAACHEGIDPSLMKMAPDLQNVGSRMQLEYLQRFIANPAATQPGTTMPHLLAAESEENRRVISEAISHYLLSLQQPAEPIHEPNADWSDGRNLYQSIGCVACHSPRNEAGKETSPTGQVSLAHVSKKYQADGLTDFLFNPLKVRPSGRMPDMNLSKVEATALSIYLMSDAVATTPQAQENKAITHTTAQIAAGKKYFETYHCNACHQVESKDAPLASFGPPRAKLQLENGCLSAKPSAAPHYSLNEEQLKSLRQALTAPHAPASDRHQIDMRLTQLNCISCHQRDDYGGVRPEIDALFLSTEAALGNEARIPPPLTSVGGKLRTEWLTKVLYDRARVRPYMTTRMPQFGDPALHGLPALLEKVDRLEPVEFAEPEEGPLKKSMVEGATLLLGDKGLNCIACHNYNGTASSGMKGLDLMTSYQRLQPAWFFAYMKNPAHFRPGIIMPNYWPDGKAIQTEILNGDSELQLRALLYQFSLGRSARDPSGLRSEQMQLTVSDKTVMHRGRGPAAGFRGIAVGLPGKISYAFNAQNGAIAGIWTGDFISVNWRQQGAGDFNPLGKMVKLPQDVAFMTLAEETSPWPLLPVTTKENPVNPDPLYPRNHGYAYVGYRLDAMQTPTFQYRSGNTLITDVSAIAPAPAKNTLRRTLTFSAAEAQTLYFRVLTGKIESLSSSAYRIPGLQLSLGESTAKNKILLRPNTGVEGEQELLIKLDLSKGSSTLILDYSLQP